jgi:hypothetical protein
MPKQGVQTMNNDLESRPPTVEDLVALCQHLNRAGALYVVIGGMAMLKLGSVRATEDIDLLVESSLENETKVIQSVSKLPDHAALEILPGEILKYQVIRVADEIVVDLMSQACGLTYGDAQNQIEWLEINDVRIPFASKDLMIRLKQTLREKDKIDLEFLKRLKGV